MLKAIDQPISECFAVAFNLAIVHITDMLERKAKLATARFKTSNLINAETPQHGEIQSGRTANYVRLTSLFRMSTTVKRLSYEGNIQHCV